MQSETYAPLLRITLRQDPEGGAALPAARAEWEGGTEVPQREVVILVHGYNNSQGEAETAYKGLRDRQKRQIANPILETRFEDQLGDLYWPGDAKWPGLLDKLDALFYADAVSVAKEVAPKIAAYLRSRDDILKVHFLAHSLGARIVLEVIRELERARTASAGYVCRVGQVCLLAAAIPTFKVLPGGELHGALLAADRLLVLYSPADPVLSGAFPAGQTMAAGDEGFFPIAVGHAGDVPTLPGKIDRQHVVGAGHSHYWGHRSGAATELSARFINEFFRFDGRAARVLQDRPEVATRKIGTRAVSAESNA